MGDNSKIEWTDATWNPIVGCSIVSPGCINCYAMGQALRIERMAAGVVEEARSAAGATGTKKVSHYAGTTEPSKAGPVWTGVVRQAPENILTAPLSWRRPRRIFVNSMGDLFHESIPDEWIDRVFAVMALAPHHTYQVLTKRAKRMREYLSRHDVGARWALEMGAGMPWVKPETAVSWSRNGLPNVWLGVSAERQQEANERIPDLLATPAAVRFVSAEPLLGPIEFLDADPFAFGELGVKVPPPSAHKVDIGFSPDAKIGGILSAIGAETRVIHRGIDWIIAGGESGPRARPMHPDWPRLIRDQCQQCGEVPFFFKQHGEWIGTPDLRRLPNGSGPGFGAYDHCTYDMEHEAVRVGKARAGRLLDGREHSAFPEVRP